MVVAAAASTQRDVPGGILIVGGLFFGVIGSVLATNYRGFADRQISESQSSNEWMRRVPPWRFLPKIDPDVRRDNQRALGALFAVIGTALAVYGIVKTVTHPIHLSVPHLHPHVSVFGLVTAAAALVAVVISLAREYRRRNSVLIQIWHRGKLARLGVALILLSYLVTTGSWAFGVEPLFIDGWCVGAVGAIITVLISLKHDEP